MTERTCRTYAEFWPYYLREHGRPQTRAIHYAGTALVIAFAILLIATGNTLWALAMPFAGYGFAWAAHFFVERNRPATFTYPLWSFAGDWVMYWQLLTGKIKFEERDAGAHPGPGPA